MTSAIDAVDAAHNCRVLYCRRAHTSAHVALRTYYLRVYWQCYEISDSKLTSLTNRGVYAKLVSLVLRDVEVRIPIGKSDERPVERRSEPIWCGGA